MPYILPILPYQVSGCKISGVNAIFWLIVLNKFSSKITVVYRVSSEKDDAEDWTGSHWQICIKK